MFKFLVVALLAFTIVVCGLTILVQLLRLSSECTQMNVVCSPSKVKRLHTGRV